MGAVGPGRLNAFRMPFDEECDAAVLDGGRDAAHPLDQACVAVGGSPGEHRRYVRCSERLGELCRQCRCIEGRRDQIQARRRSPLIRGRSSRSRHPANLCAGRSGVTRARRRRHGRRCNIMPPSSPDRLSTGRGSRGRSCARDARRRAGRLRRFPVFPTTPSAAPPGARGRRRTSAARAIRRSG